MDERRLGMPLGLQYMAFAAFFFSLMNLLVKVAGSRIPSQEIVLSRSLVVMLLTLWLMRRGRVPVWGVRKGLLLLRSVLGFSALSCFYFALTRLTLADATVLQFTSPVFTAVLAAFFLGERLEWKSTALILLSLGGVSLVARPAFLFGAHAAALDPLAVTVTLIGASLSAGAYVTVRRLNATEDPLVIVFYFAAFSMVASVPIVVADAALPRGLDWLVLLGVGLTTMAAQVALTHALRLEEAARAVPVGYLQIVFAAFWGMLFFREYPDTLGLVGAVLVIAGTLGIGRTRRHVPLPPSEAAPLRRDV
ncbi:MAG TPA: DMT family transporter [Longimicrobiales bacterium]|nr:DMT family transporter [Longimicrobiales bacterium]